MHRCYVYLSEMQSAAACQQWYIVKRLFIFQKMSTQKAIEFIIIAMYSLFFPREKVNIKMTIQF